MNSYSSRFGLSPDDGDDLGGRRRPDDDPAPPPEPREFHPKAHPNAELHYSHEASSVYMYDRPAPRTCTDLLAKPKLLMACEDIPDAETARAFAAVLLVCADEIDAIEGGQA